MRRLLALALLLCLLAPMALADDGRVFYEIFPASFYDADGDGIGDLAGISLQLDYLTDLGVGGLWLMPVHPSPSYHKYDVMDYYAVDPAYGTVEDLRALADGLHARDMRLLLDLVINHTSVRHPWFLSATAALNAGEDSPYIDYYHSNDSPVPGWHQTPGAAGWYYEGGFDAAMPDLNLESEAVRAEIADICAYWMGLGVDGFRLDAVAHYIGEDAAANTAFLSWLMGELRAINPDVYVVGECWMDAGTIERYYASGISSLFNFPLAGPEGAIISAIRGGDGAALARRLVGWDATLRGLGAQDAPFLSNHDIARVAGTLTRNEDRLKLAASIYLTLPGHPFVYYGEEIGMTGSGRDENKRLPMLWSDDDATGLCLPPANADQQARTFGSVAAQRVDEASLLTHYRALLAQRNASPALREGALAAIDTGIDALCAYARTHETETAYVLHNLGKEPVEVEIDGHVYTVFPLSSIIDIRPAA